MQYIVEQGGPGRPGERTSRFVTVLVMDAKTGEILAYPSLPEFDPNEFQKDSPQIDPPSADQRPGDTSCSRAGVQDLQPLLASSTWDAITANRIHFRGYGFYEKKLANGGDDPHPRHLPLTAISHRSRSSSTPAIPGPPTHRRRPTTTASTGCSRASDSASRGGALQGETCRRSASVASGRRGPSPPSPSGRRSGIRDADHGGCHGDRQRRGPPQAAIVKKIVFPQGTVVKEFGGEPLWEVISPGSAQTMLEWMESRRYRPGRRTGQR